jgi:hypothetical protein
MHDNKRFGFYMDNQFPRAVKPNCDGMTSNKKGDPKPSCGQFTQNGEDNGVVNTIEDQVPSKPSSPPPSSTGITSSSVDTLPGTSPG